LPYSALVEPVGCAQQCKIDKKKAGQTRLSLFDLDRRFRTDSLKFSDQSRFLFTLCSGDEKAKFADFHTAFAAPSKLATAFSTFDTHDFLQM